MLPSSFSTLAASLLVLAPPDAASRAAPPKDASGIRWIHDDWSKAKAQALEEGKLVVVDAWATWCHTCLSMKSFVLTHASLRAVSEKRTFLALDFDRPENGAFFERFKVSGLPTFLVIDPGSETIVGRWVGSGSPEEISSFFASAGAESTEPLVLGHRALAAEDSAKARAIFEAALAAPQEDPTQKTRLLYGLVEALSKQDPQACAKVGLARLTEVDGTSTQGLDLIAMIASCAGELGPDEKPEALRAIRDRLTAIATPFSKTLAVDDRSGALAVLLELHEALGEKDKAASTARARLELLEDAARRAPTAAARATFDAHRMEEYLRAHRYADARKMLMASERAQPGDFNHPWRLARVYLEEKKTKPGLAAIERALARGYGARRLRMHATKADLLIADGRFEDARRTIDAGLAEVQGLGEGQVRESWVKELESRRAKLP